MGEIIKPVETKYIHNPHCREYILFPEEYFSGSQVSIFFNHKHLVDCSSFSFALQEQHKPIYGYASRTFDEMSIGNRIVVGTFKVAFQDAGKLNAILNEIENYKQDTRDATQLFLENEDVPAWMSEAGYTPELLLGMAMENDPSIVDTDLKTIKIYFRNNRIYLPVDTPAMLRQAEDGHSYSFVPIRWLLMQLGYPTENIKNTGPNEVTFTHRDGTSVVVVDYSKHEVHYNGRNILSADGRPLMAFDFEDREYIHVRPLYEAMGYKVSWNEKDLRVDIT